MATMAANPVLLNGFAGSFASFHGGSLDECEKQTLLLTNAVTIKCPWTVAAHSTFALEDGMAEADVNAIRAGKLPADPKYAALSGLSRALVEKRGNVSEGDIERFTSGYRRWPRRRPTWPARRSKTGSRLRRGSLHDCWRGVRAARLELSVS
jgi:alkylhydroperoxidase family enzyme